MNVPTIITAFLLAVSLFAIVFSQVRNKKSGKSSCSCGAGCSGCSMNCSCHPQK